MSFLQALFHLLRCSKSRIVPVLNKAPHHAQICGRGGISSMHVSMEVSGHLHTLAALHPRDKQAGWAPGSLVWMLCSTQNTHFLLPETITQFPWSYSVKIHCWIIYFIARAIKSRPEDRKSEQAEPLICTYHNVCWLGELLHNFHSFKLNWFLNVTKLSLCIINFTVCILLCIAIQYYCTTIITTNL
jgi:hypothetical protein